MLGFVSKKKYQEALWRAERAEEDYTRTSSRYGFLRNNCFITNARGHRVRYWKATLDEQAKAEGRV